MPARDSGGSESGSLSGNPSPGLPLTGLGVTPAARSDYRDNHDSRADRAESAWLVTVTCQSASGSLIPATEADPLI